MTSVNTENESGHSEAQGLTEALRVDVMDESLKTGFEEQENKDYSKGVVDLTVGKPLKSILTFALPLFVGNVFQLFYSWTDAIVVGLRNVDDFGAISATMPVVNLLITVMLGFMAGAVVVLGQFFGKKDYNNVRKCFVTTICVLAAITVVISILGFVFTRPLLKLINVSEILIDNGTVYLQVYCAGMVFMIFYNCFAQILRSLGNSKVPLYVLIFSAVLNVGLDFLFVFAFNMGVVGVAVATMISQALSVVLLIFYTQFKVPLLRLIQNKGEARVRAKDVFSQYFDGDILKRIMRLATPSTLQQASAAIGFIIINALVNAKGREFTIAFGTGNRIDELLNAIMMSFGIAMTNFVAQNKGKGDIERIKKGYNSAFITSCVTIVALAGFIMIFRDFFISVFTTSTDNTADIDRVRDIAATYMGIVLPFYFLMSIMVFTTSSLRGAGDAKAAMTVNLFSLCIRVSCAVLFTTATIRIFSLDIEFFKFIENTFPSFYPFFKDYGVFFASPIGWLAGAVFGIVRFKRGRWKKLNIVSAK